MQLEIYHMVVLFGFTVRSLQLHAIRNLPNRTNLNIFCDRENLSYQFPQLLEFEPNFMV